MGEFLQELKRRNVVRVGVAYLIVGWLIVQIIETVSDPLGLPAWTVAFFIVLLLAGFPVAVIFAWAFELTPEGMKKTREVDREKSVTAVTGKKLNNAIIVALVLALAYFIFERQVLHDHSDDETSETVATVEEMPGTSIAVLPFVNMSADEEQEYFSDGIAEELLNLLAKIPELRVAARTSSFQFKGQNLDIGKVAEQLKVKHVLEGSVRKANTRVRITAQLIEADTGYHLWSDTYDRELTDIFGIQDEISAAIVAALSQTLGLAPGEAPQVLAAANTEAYNAYLLGQYLIKKRTRPDIEEAIVQFEKSLQLDPDYAPAHAGLALGALLMMRSDTTYGDWTLEDSLSIAKPHIERALELDPGSAEAHAIRGLALDNELRIKEALASYEEALRLNPSLTDVRSWYSILLGDAGRPAEAFEAIKAAYAVDPLSVLTLNNYVNNLLQRRMHDEAGPVIDQLEQLDPVRAGFFRGVTLDLHRQLAEGVKTIIRSSDIRPDAGRGRAQAAGALARIGLLGEAKLLWPFPDAELVFGLSEEAERQLELAEKDYLARPEDVSAIETFAWASLLAGHNERALELAQLYLDRLSADVGEMHDINVIYAIDGWQRGDAGVVDARITPVERVLRARLDAGIDSQSTHWFLGIALYLRGHEDEALAEVRTAFSRGSLPPPVIDYGYSLLGFADKPRFAAARADYDEYIATEQQKFLDYACGEIGFDVWKPQQETCEPVARL